MKSKDLRARQRARSARFFNKSKLIKISKKLDEILRKSIFGSNKSCRARKVGGVKLGSKFLYLKRVKSKAKKTFSSVASGRSELFKMSKIIRRPTRFFFDFGSGRISQTCQELRPSKVSMMMKKRVRLAGGKAALQGVPTSTASSFPCCKRKTQNPKILEGCNF